MSAARVSVLIPVYNTRDYVEQAVESVRQQTYSDWELVALDDGSRDGSLEVLQRLAAREPRLRVIARENRGVIATRNELIGAARGEFLAWLDSDDVATPERLSLQIRRFEREPELVVVGGSAERTDPEGMPLGIERYQLTHAEIVAEQARGSGIRFGTTMMRTEAVRRVGSFRGEFLIGEDLDLLIRLGEVGRLANIPETLLRYRQHLASSATESYRARWHDYRDTILALAKERRETGSDRLQRGERVTIPELRASAGARPPSAVHAAWVHEALLHGHRRSALKHGLLAVRKGPSSPAAWKSLIRATLGLAPRGDS